GDYSLLWDIIDRTAEIKDNVRLVLGKMDFDLYKLYHYVSSVFAIPSRWEPFGINAIEAMALGLPVVAYAVGGLRETIIDIREDRDNGTGLLVKPESIDELAKSLKISIYLSQASENNDIQILSRIQEFKVDDPKYWDKVRRNSINRVKSKFRWEEVINSLLECYKKALNMANYRALASF
ncbi:MAG: glycosyltransferase, partial [Saccharolobus sp.]